MTNTNKSSQGRGSSSRRTRSWSRMAINLSGVAVFAVYYRMTGSITAATWALVIASAAAVGVGLLVERKIAWLPLFLGLVPTLTGILSLFFDDSGILKGAMTATHLLLGMLMLGGLALGANPLKKIFGGSVDLPDGAWWQLALRFGLFALVIVLGNEIIRHTQSNAVWVAFRFPGVPIMYALFLFTQWSCLRGYPTGADSKRRG